MLALAGQTIPHSVGQPRVVHLQCTLAKLHSRRSSELAAGHGPFAGGKRPLRWLSSIGAPLRPNSHLTLLAEKDRIIDNIRHRQFIERFASHDKKVIEYPGAHHTWSSSQIPKCI